LPAPRKLTTTEIAVVRGHLLAKQGFRCPLCNTSIKTGARGGGCLDHDHDTGFVRAVLCRTCNGGEGKIRSLAMRYGGGKENHVEWLTRLTAYLALHSKPQSHYVHPTHLSDEEKRVKKNTKARTTRAKANGTLVKKGVLVKK
jgi:hypothetical protein